MNIFRFTQRIFDIDCQSKDIADFHYFPGKLEPLTLSTKEVMDGVTLGNPKGIKNAVSISFAPGLEILIRL